MSICWNATYHRKEELIAHTPMLVKTTRKILEKENEKFP